MTIPLRGPRSLVGRLSLLGVALFAVSIPIFWALFTAAVTQVSEEVVDTRVLELGDQLRGFYASTEARQGIGVGGGPGRGPGNGPGNGPRGRPEPILGGLDVEWVWQISENSQVTQRSPLLRLSNTELPAVIAKSSSIFTLRTGDTPLGPVRLAERIVEEPSLTGEGPGTTVHYIVGVAMDRYRDQVAQHAARLNRLTILAALPVSVTLFVLVALVIFLLKRSMGRVENAMHVYEKGDSPSIDGHFPAELQSLVDRMNGLLRQNSKLIERTRKYVTKIAHDINHPLAIIKNSLAGDADREMMDRQVDRMVGLVDRYSSLARAIGPEGQAGVRTNMAELMNDVAEGFSILYRRTPLKIDVRCPDDIWVRIPRHDLEAMISNLVSNAHKYAGGAVELTTALNDDVLSIIVEDDGPGIPPEERDAALNWGKRLDEAPPGTGFGLSIVYDIVDLYDGSVEMGESRLGGLSIEIRLPLQQA